MPLYTALETLIGANAKVFTVGSEIELTAEQAERLGKARVELIERKEEFVPGESYGEAEFRALPAEDQKRKVEELGGDLKEITNADSRWTFVSENQV